MGWRTGLRKSLLVFLSFALIASWASAWGVNSALADTSIEQEFEGKKVHFNGADDSVSAAIPIGFDFAFYGTSHSSLYASTNGLLMFENPSSECCEAESTLPLTSSPDHFITAFYEDLHMGSDGIVLYKTIGEIGDRKFIIQFTNMRTYTNRNNQSFGTFQVILYERDNGIQFQYPSLVDHAIYGDSAFGSNALIGVQSPEGDYSVYSQQEKSLTEKQAIRFKPDGPNGYTVETSLEDTGFAPYAADVLYEPILLTPKPLPESSTAVSPEDGSYETTSVTFQWSASNGAISYDLLIATDPEFDNTVVVQRGIQELSYSVTGLRDGQSYYWKIAAETKAVIRNPIFTVQYRHK